VINKVQLFFCVFPFFCFSAVAQSYSWQEANHLMLNMQYEKLYQVLPYIRNTPVDKCIAEYSVFHSYIIQSLVIQSKKYENKVKYYYENVVYYCQKLPENSPYKLYLIGEMDFEMALVYLQDKSYWSAVWKIKSAYQKLSECAEKHPDFYESYKTLGILHTMIGNIPRKYAWMTNILGFKGTIQQGEKELLLCIQKADIQQTEAQLVYAYMCMNIYLKREKSLDIASEMPKQYPESKYIATICALICTKLNHDEEGMYIVEKLGTFDKDYLDFAFTEYIIAEYALHRNDKNTAVQHYKNYVSKTQNDLFKADSYFKTGLCYELQNKRNEALTYYQKSIAEPNSEQEEDKQAKKYAQELLKKPLNAIQRDLRIARNYADGGYYEKAIKQIEKYQQNLLVYEVNEQLEWYYRMARTEHAQKKWQSALEYYQKCTQISLTQPIWMQVYAWYYMGTVYETQKNNTKAKECYQKALSYDGYEYQNSLERRAKAALQRVK
jgi:tetratricopeptide (TPR) repeat protein